MAVPCAWFYLSPPARTLSLLTSEASVVDIVFARGRNAHELQVPKASDASSRLDQRSLAVFIREEVDPLTVAGFLQRVCHDHGLR